MVNRCLFALFKHEFILLLKTFLNTIMIQVGRHGVLGIHIVNVLILEHVE